MTQLAPIPVIDVAPLVGGPGDLGATAAAIGRACRDFGFFYVTGHGVDPALEARLFEQARRFFALPLEAKQAIRMERGGAAWRGWFPVGAELTSGRPDWKEGLYFGTELPPDHPRVRAGTPLHGPNLFPDLAGFRETVLAWMDAMTQLGHALMRGIALSLGLPATWFADRYTADPLVLFRIFDYPAIPASDPGGWSVGEHTDYGVLTILRQDDAGGLEVHARGRWIDVAPVREAFVCNLGDMLERMTGGRFRSTPHRVQNRSGRGRLSFPFFFDPGWDAAMAPLPGCEAPEDPSPARPRWDGESPLAFDGRYGDYVLSRVSRVFPALGDAVLRRPGDAAG